MQCSVSRRYSSHFSASLPLQVEVPRYHKTDSVLAGVRTNIMSSVDLSKMDRQAMAKMKPLYDLGLANPAEPGDIADVIAFLVSDMSRHISGAIIPVDKGLSTI